MSEYIIPALLKKNISFRRLPRNACSMYEIYAEYEDATQASGVRTELIDTISNPSEPSPVIKRISLEHEKEPTWMLPDDAFYDRDHHFRLFQNGHALPTIYYNYNRVTKLFSLDEQIMPYQVSDEMELEYYVDVIEKSYQFEEGCKIIVRPVFSGNYDYGDHNIII